MARLVFLPFVIFGVVATLAWSISLYIEVQEHWRAQRLAQPRSRPVLSRPIVIQGGKKGPSLKPVPAVRDAGEPIRLAS
jgi:uncharacterized iron-regulated membrane protein